MVCRGHLLGSVVKYQTVVHPNIGFGIRILVWSGDDAQGLGLGLDLDSYPKGTDPCWPCALTYCEFNLSTLPRPSMSLNDSCRCKS